LISFYNPTIPLSFTLRKKSKTLRNLVEVEEKDITCKLKENKTYGHYTCEIQDAGDNLEEFENLEIESDTISGIRDDNRDILEVDRQIQNGIITNCSNEENIVVPKLKNIGIKDDNCNSTGIFYLNGTLHDKKVDVDGESEINFIIPDSGALCKYNKANINEKITLECQNKNDFNDQTIVIGNQFINDTILLEKFVADDSTTCDIGSLSYKESEETFNNIEISEIYNNNKYYSKTSSSGGLSGGAIAAIVIVCSLVVVGVGVLIVLLKNGILSSKVREDTSTAPQISSSSANII
jgi:hypothetical protein